jgi:predicted SAM-dependent methyltransferase
MQQALKKMPPTLASPDNLPALQEAGLWQKGRPLRLHLGCGEQHFEGYVNIDYPPAEHNVMTVQADAYADILRLDFPPGSVDEVRLHHVFEHFNRVTALALLIKWHGWLKEGGQLRIETPDLVGSAKTLSSAKSSWKRKMAAARHLAGDQSAAWGYHLDHWFAERYERTLARLGFGAIQVNATCWPQEPHLANVEVTAAKERRTPEEQLAAADELLWDSTVADAEKATHEVWRRQLRALLQEGALLPAPANAVAPDISGWAGATRMLEGLAGKGSFAWFGRKRRPPPVPLETIHNFNQHDRDEWVAAKAATVPAGLRVLDVGAGTCPYRALFAHCDYRTQDFKKYDGVKLGNTREYGRIDYVSEITQIPLPDGSVDVVLCTEVLEHVPEPIEVLRELDRLLKPGGRMFLTAPLGSGLHQLPFHFYGGYTPEWYRYFAKKFGLEVVEITANGGFFKLLAQECARFAWTFEEHRQCHGKNGEPLRKLFGDLLPRYLFALDGRHRNEQFTVGYHVELKKPEAAEAALTRGKSTAIFPKGPWEGF